MHHLFSFKTLLPLPLLSSAAFAQDVALSTQVDSMVSERTLPVWWYIAPTGSLLALLMAFFFYRSIMKNSEGNEQMKEIAQHVREGAYAYLKRQYIVVGIFFASAFLLLALVSFGLHVQHPLVPFAFMTSGFFSGLAGFFGMKTATSAAARTAKAASESLDQGLKVAFRAGAVMGLIVVGLALLDYTIWFAYLYKFHHVLFGGDEMSLQSITMIMLCFGMGASSQALFARVGGGIYTKAADVGADLVGKVEVGIPEDDPRNPATIADNVGDNVGDVAGMGADLYESYAGAILATGALGVAAAASLGAEESLQFAYLASPAVLAGLGILSAVIGIISVRAKDGADMTSLLHSLDLGIYIASGLVVVFSLLLVHTLGLPFSTLMCIIVGLVLGLVIGKGTEWATAAEYKPTQQIAAQSRTGPATLIIAGIAEGMLSTWIPILAVSVGMLLSFGLSGGFENLYAGLYGIGMAAVGMLSTLGITLATDAYGPISDNAGGIAEMAVMPKEVRERTDMLDSLGNTTAAIGKGFAIGSAALTALALLASYVEAVRIGIHRDVASARDKVSIEAPAVHDLGYGKIAIYIPGGDGTFDSNQDYTVSCIETKLQASTSLLIDSGERKGNEVSVVVNKVGKRVPETLELTQGPVQWSNVAQLPDFMLFYNVTLTNPKVLVGVFMGVLVVFIFSALTMLAVGRAASSMVEEVRRQFKEKPGIMAGTEKPDYARCVAISTAGAQKEMILPSVLAISIPIVVGLVLNVAGVMGLLAGTLASGFAMAVFMANSGGAWDNAKKYIETGEYGGKGSDSHKAAVVGDTVGDPFKDTSGPSLNILIKLTSIVSIVFAGVIVKFAPAIGAFLGIG